MQIRNISPYGALDVPLLRREGEPYDEHGEGCLAGGEVVDVTREQAEVLLEQHENFEPADDDAQAVRDAIDERLAAVAAADQVDENAGPPAVSARKPAWVAWAVAQGADPVEAEAMTQKQLIDTFGGDRS